MFIENWQFHKGTLDNGFAADCDPALFAPVTVPHTWNNIDGQDGCPTGKTIKDTDYYKGDGWYRTCLAISDTQARGRVFLRFEGANSRCTVYVNGQEIGSHKGGYTAYCAEITDNVHPGADNLLAVRVSNAKVPEIAPLQADFTFYGGLYRPVELLFRPNLSFCLTDHGTRGLEITTPAVTREQATCTLTVAAENITERAETITFTATLGEEYKEQCTLTLPPQSRTPHTFTFTIDRPHLWDGRRDPYLYPVAVTLAQDGNPLDSVQDEIGFRYYHIDKEKGFFLNGRPYPLRGVSRHQDREGLGNALTQKEHDEDFAILNELGVTAVRLAHYPQAEYFYRLCDRAGILVWAEIPFLELVGGSGSYRQPDSDRTAFFACTRLQLEEMIHQNRNHPAIFCWGLQNEVLMQYDDVMVPFMEDLHTFAKALDPQRPTTQATNQKTAYGWKSDLICWNVYPGWYGMPYTALGRFMDKMRTDRPLGISEYGAGANYHQQEANPRRVQHDGQWHPEQYQTKCHGAFIDAIDRRPYLWCTFVWNLFDFGSDGRKEGDRPGMNDKGLVSFDRKVKKDAYYLYQAHWSDVPMLHIADRRYTHRRRRHWDIQVFSNADRVTLTVNGRVIGTKTQAENDRKGTYIWRHCKLQTGANTIAATGTKDGVTVTDSYTVDCDRHYPKRQVSE